MKKIVPVLSSIAPVAVAILILVKEPGTIFVFLFFLTILGVVMILPGRKKAIADVLPNTLFTRKDRRYYFKIEDGSCVPVKIMGTGDGVHTYGEAIYRVGENVKFDPKEIVTVRTVFEDNHHPDLRLDKVYT